MDQDVPASGLFKQAPYSVQHPAESDAALATILNIMPQIVWSAGPDGYHDFYNDRWYDFTGVPRGSTDGDLWKGLFHPDDQPSAWERWQHSLATGDPYEVEYRLRGQDGSYRWSLGRALPLRDACGGIVRWYGSVTDIHDRKVAEEQCDIVAAELAHRIRNIFAVVSSLLMLAARSQPEASSFADEARLRIDSLARANDYIHPDRPGRAGAAEAVSMQGLLHALLKPYNHSLAGVPRIRISGPDLRINATAATSLALVVHELATNAIKHGSLSVDEGRLAISTLLDDEVATIEWTERGGPAIREAPTRRGFGTTLSERALKLPLAGVVEREWDPGGLTARIRIPKNRLTR